MKTPLIASLVSVTLVTVCAPVHGAIDIVVTPAGDGYHHDELGSSYDYFDSSALSNIVHYQFYGTSDTVIRNTSYAQFSLDSFAPGAEIGLATLNIFLTEIHYGDESPSGGFVYHVANASSANGLASQRLTGSEVVVNIKDQPLGWLSLDVTGYLQNDLDNGYSYAAFSFSPDTAGYFRNAGFSFTSGDALTNQPFLSVVVPEPGYTALLLGSAAVVLARLRRRV